MALYTASTVAALAAKVRRSLRDAGGAVFSTDQITDFINYGLGELSVIRPVETTVVINSAEKLTGIDATPGAYTTLDLDYVWAVEVYGLPNTQYDGHTQYISPEDSGTNWRNGWDFVGGMLVLPQSTVNWLTDVWALPVPTHALRVRGYRHRKKIADLTTGSADLSSLPEEQAVVVLAQQAGFEAMMNDRALYQQWQTATHATDVSPTQLTNMAYGAQAKWDRMRKHLYLIRRPLQGAQ